MFLFFYKNFETTAKIYGIIFIIAIIYMVISKIFGPEDSCPELGSLKIGISTEYCPHGNVDEKEIKGYIPDVCRYLAITTDKKLKIRGTTWKEFVPLLKNGTIHAAILNKKNPVSLLNPEINKITKVALDKENILLFSPFYKMKDKILAGLITTKYKNFLKQLRQKWSVQEFKKSTKEKIIIDNL